MGSGLILLVIVGAWLAVLVPMALRSHDAADTSRTTDRFSDAMRVLSRRTQEAWTSRTAEQPEAELLESGQEQWEEPRPALTAAQRRLRVLVGLGSVTAVGLLGSLAVGWLLVPGLLGAVLTAAYVALLRSQVLRRHAFGEDVDGIWYAEQEWAQDTYDSYDGTWEEPELPSTAARWEDPFPASLLPEQPVDDDSWSPVPVPTPTYLSAPMAPPREARTIDLTGYEDTPVPGAEEDLELDDILDRRRAVGGW